MSIYEHSDTTSQQGVKTEPNPLINSGGIHFIDEVALSQRRVNLDNGTTVNQTDKTPLKATKNTELKGDYFNASMAYSELSIFITNILDVEMSSILEYFSQFSRKEVLQVLQSINNPKLSLMVETSIRKINTIQFQEQQNIDRKKVYSMFVEVINTLEQLILNKLPKIIGEPIIDEIIKKKTLDISLATSKIAVKTPILTFISTKITDWGKEIANKDENQTIPVTGQNIEQSEKAQKSDVFYDPELESVYEKLTAKLLDNDPKVAQEWFIKFMNLTQIANNLRPLELADISSMICIAVTSTSASEIVGINITRPVFLFTDDNQFKSFLKILNSEGVNGFAVGLQPKNTDKKLSIIVSSNNIDTISHEFKHSIDYNTYNREGAGQLLAEMFAQYYDQVGIFGKNTASINWENLEKTMTNQGYYEQLLDHKPDISKLNKETYDEVVGLIVQQLRACYEKTFDHIFVQRLLLQSISLQELLRRINDVVQG